ncbi:hypothetical protein Tco_0415571 [Tanacetum coccineum]
MATMAENVIDAGAKNRPLMLEKGMYDSWKSHILLYIEGKDNGEMLIDSIKNGPFQLKKEITILATEDSPEIKRPQELNDLKPKEKLQKSYDIKATNIILLGTWVINTVGDVKENQPRVIRCYHCKGEAQEAEVIFREEKQDFLADGLEEFNSDCDDLQLNKTSIFKVEHVDAFDSDYDEEPTASAIFMARLSPVGSVNRADVSPTYDSDILSKVPHYDTYHETDMLNPVVQETRYFEHLVSNIDSCDELTSNNNVISYAEYMVTIENDAAQSIPSHEKRMIML